MCQSIQASMALFFSSASKFHQNWTGNWLKVVLRIGQIIHYYQSISIDAPICEKDKQNMILNKRVSSSRQKVCCPIRWNEMKNKTNHLLVDEHKNKIQRIFNVFAAMLNGHIAKPVQYEFDF